MTFHVTSDRREVAKGEWTEVWKAYRRERASHPRSSVVLWNGDERVVWNEVKERRDER